MLKELQEIDMDYDYSYWKYFELLRLIFPTIMMDLDDDNFQIFRNYV